MKHLRLFNLLVIVLLLAAWAPAPQSLFDDQPVSALAYYVSIGSMSPATGAKVASTPNTTWPTFKWKITATTTGQPTPDQVTIQIADNTAFTNPIVDDNTIPTLANGTLYTYNVTNGATVPSNKKLYWRVKAVSNTKGTKVSAALNFITKPYKVTTVVSPVDGATNLDTLRPALSWQPEGDPRAASYNIQLSKDANFLVGVVKYVAKQPYFEIPVDLTKNTVYYWKVQPVGLALGDFSDAWSFTVPDKTPPAQPVLTFPLTGTAVPTYTPTLKWKSTFADSNFYLQFSFDTLFLPTSTQTFTLTEALGVTKDAAGLWNFTIPPDLLPSATLFWRIQTVDLTNQMTSAWSKPFSFKTPSELQILVTDPLGGPAPMGGMTVTISKTSACPVTVPANIIAQGVTSSAQDITLGTLMLNGITAGTRYACVTDEVHHYYAPLRKTLTIAAGKVYIPPVTQFNVVHPQVKVVFTWGATPRDMDTQLWLPDTLPTGEDPVLLYSDGMKGTDLKFPWAKILNDAYGTATTKTETLLIKNRYPGKYVYAVLNKYKDFDPALNVKFTTTAKVKVFYLNGTVWTSSPELEFRPATEPSGRFWYVFDIDGMTGVITPVNKFVSYTDAATTFPYDPYGGLGASAMPR